MAVMRSLVANGFGYSVANIRPRTEFSPDGQKLRFVPLVGPVRTLSLGLLLAEGARNICTIRAFVEHASAEISPSGIPASTSDFLRLQLNASLGGRGRAPPSLAAGLCPDPDRM